MPNLLKTEGSADGRDDLIYSGTVIDAFFVSNEYGQSLGIKTRLDDADLVRYAFLESGEHTQYFGLGKIAAVRSEPRIAWQVVDDGKAVKGDTDDRMFRADSKIGRLIDQLATLPNIDVLGDDFDPRLAEHWKRLGHVKWDHVVVQRSMPTGERKPDRKGVMRDEFKVQSVKEVLPVTLGGAETTPYVEAVDIDSFGLTSEQKLALSDAAKANPDDKAFVAACFAVPGVMANSPFVTVLNANPAGVRESLPF